MQSSPNRSESAATTTRPAPCSVDREQRRAGRRGRRPTRARTRTSPPSARRRRVERRRRGRSTPRGRARAGRRPPSGLLEVGEDPVRRAAVALVVGDRVVRDPDAEAAPSSSLRLLPYLACSLSPSTIRPPPACTNASIAVQLRVGQRRRAARHDAAPTRAPTGARAPARRRPPSAAASSGSRARGQQPRGRAGAARRPRARTRSPRDATAGSRARPRDGWSRPGRGTRRRGCGRRRGETGIGLQGARGIACHFYPSNCIESVQESKRMDAIDQQIVSLLVRRCEAIVWRHRPARLALRPLRQATRRRAARERRDRGLHRACSTTGALGQATEALIELFYAPGTLLDEVAEQIAAHPEIVEAWSVTGDGDAIVRVHTTDNKDLERLIMELQKDGASSAPAPRSSSRTSSRRGASLREGTRTSRAPATRRRGVRRGAARTRRRAGVERARDCVWRSRERVTAPGAGIGVRRR